MMSGFKARRAECRKGRNIVRHQSQQRIVEARIYELRVAIATYLDRHWPDSQPVPVNGLLADDMARWIYGQCLSVRPLI